MKKILFLVLLIPATAFAGAKVLTPLPSQPDYLTAQAVAGVNPNGDVMPIQLDLLGNLTFVPTDPVWSPINFGLSIPLAGPADRIQIPANVIHSCLLQAPSNNVGNVYYGGANVTNALGVNEGISLIPGDTVAPVSLNNTNQLYVATDNANDRIKVFCN